MIDIEAGNKTIALFMGWQLVNINDEPTDSDFDCWVFKNKLTGVSDSGIDGQFYNENSTLPFDTDWNLLMGVVEKLEESGYEIDIFGKCIDVSFGPDETHILDLKGKTKIEAVYRACVDIIIKDTWS
jgi:hypothetical protein